MLCRACRLFISLDAYFIGTLQILVYAGAVMVLFLFIIMLLDIKAEAVKKGKRGELWPAIVSGILVASSVHAPDRCRVLHVISRQATRSLDEHGPLQCKRNCGKLGQENRCLRSTRTI